MGLLNLLITNPIAFILLTVPLLYSVILHELAHGWVAYKMGDPTARSMGRLSLNPIKHLDPIGTMMLFLVGFGWAKPVPVNFSNLKKDGKAMLWVSSAGIFTNFLLAFTTLFIIHFFSITEQSLIGAILSIVARINIVLAALNLIPIPPLDGSKMLMEFLPQDLKYQFSRIEPFGIFILLGLLVLDLLNPIIKLISGALEYVIKLLLGG